MKCLRRLMCRLLGHREPNVAVYNGCNILIYCPRCKLIFSNASREEPGP